MENPVVIAAIITAVATIVAVVLKLIFKGRDGADRQQSQQPSITIEQHVDNGGTGAINTGEGDITVGHTRDDK